MIAPLSDSAAPSPLAVLARYGRSAVIILTNLYIVGLIAYLGLRWLLGDSLWWLALLHNFAPLYFLPLIGLIPLAILLRSKGTLARLLLLGAVAALWYGPYFLPKSIAPADGPTLKVATFNTFPDNSRIDDVAAWLREIDADVVLLQEVPVAYTEEGFPQLADLYPHQFNLPYETGRSDQFILSRYPFLSEDGFDLEGDGWPTHQRVTLTFAGQTIAFYNVHLLMPVSGTTRLRLPAFLGIFDFALKYDASARDAEIANLLRLLEDETLPYIVAGDFNTSDQAVIYGDMAGQMGDSFREAGVGFGMSWPAGASEELPDVLPSVMRLDYIWHSAHFRALDAHVGPRLGSDHLPLVATLALTAD